MSLGKNYAMVWRYIWFNLSAPIIDKRANPNAIIVAGSFKVHSIFPPVMIANTQCISLY